MIPAEQRGGALRTAVRASATPLAARHVAWAGRNHPYVGEQSRGMQPIPDSRALTQEALDSAHARFDTVRANPLLQPRASLPRLRFARHRERTLEPVKPLEHRGLIERGSRGAQRRFVLGPRGGESLAQRTPRR
jgi:hypothetical protein